MPLITEFKEALLKAVNNFSQKEGSLTQTQSQTVIDLKHQVESVDSAVTLRQEMVLQLRKIPIKSLAWLPFVNDLSKEIRKVLESPQFAENQLLIADYCDIRGENKQLRKENDLLRKEFEAFKASAMPQEIANAIQHVKQENLQLKDELEQREQELKLVSQEKKSLEQSVITLTEEMRSVEEELEKTKEEKDQLAKDHLQKLEENTSLKEENKRLKKELEAYQQTKGTDNAKQNNPPYRPSFQFS